MDAMHTFATAAAALSAIAVLGTVLRGAPPGPQASARGETLVYLGTYTGEKSKGIYLSRLDLTSGALSAPELVAETPSPSFLAVHSSHRYLYAVNEVGKFEGKPTGSVSAFAVDSLSGKLTALNQQSSGGSGPAHLVVDRTGTNVLVANYGGGSVAVLPINERNGTLKPPSATVQHTGSGPNPERQKAPHAHSINVDAANRLAYAADLGLDKILIYRFNPKEGSLVANDPPFAPVEPGAGPRHFAFHPEGQFAYVINEMHCTITAFTVDPKTGALKALQTISTLPAGRSVEKGFSTAEIQVHPSGRFLYGSNRGHDSVAVFAIDQKTGQLTLVEHEPTGGSTPRNFGIDPTGAYLLAANQRSDSVLVFRIDQKTGALADTGHKIEVGSPVCVKFIASRER
jgi:6-phosphogluconolactonase